MSNFTLEKKITNASFPRWPGSTILSNKKLKIVYNKYKSTKKYLENDTKVNLIFIHGIGMNKSIWNYHTKKLYQLAETDNWNLDSVIAIDAVGHGDSSLLNKRKLGWCYKWDEGGKDVIEIIKHEQLTCNDFVNNTFNKNILIGHSLGGFLVVLAAFYEPHLFDSVIPVEAVLYTDYSIIPRFNKIFTRLADMIIDEFDNEKDFNNYFTEMFIYKSFMPEVLKDFMTDELYTKIDPVTKKIKYKTKTSAANQITAYLSSSISIPLGMTIYSHLKIPVCHVIGKKANWNPPQSIPFVRNAIPKHLLTTVDIKDGDHLVNCEKPDVIVSVIESFIKDRVKAADEHKEYVPEIKLKGNKEKIMEAQSKFILQGKIEDATNFKSKL